MLTRHEEKYIIDYRQYVMLRSRAMEVLTPDANGDNGSYIITSVYFDDHRDNALYEKLDGLPEHSKFRIRTYNYSGRTVKLERKDKHGILTHKEAARLTHRQARDMIRCCQPEDLSEQAQALAAQMRAGDLRPTVAVRYRRDAFTFPGSDLRLTFDTDLEAIIPVEESLFSETCTGIPVLDRNQVIMEIKYGSHLPAFLRKLTNVSCMQLSVSKYALCRQQRIL